MKQLRRARPWAILQAAGAVLISAAVGYAWSPPLGVGCFGLFLLAFGVAAERA